MRVETAFDLLPVNAHLQTLDEHLLVSVLVVGSQGELQLSTLLAFELVVFHKCFQ